MVEHGRVVRLVEDVIRIHPGGAPTRVLVQRLLRAGLEPGEAQELLVRMERAARIACRGQRWVIRTG